MSFTISPAKNTDSVTLTEIATETNIDAWTPEDYADEINRIDSVVLKAENPTTQIVGFLVARMVPGSDHGIDADLYNIAVRISQQGKGIGSDLLSNLVKDLQYLEVGSIWLEVRSLNKTAIKFYEKHGFQVISTRKGFYSSPNDDAVIMRLELS